MWKSVPEVLVIKPNIFANNPKNTLLNGVPHVIAYTYNQYDYPTEIRTANPYTKKVVLKTAIKYVCR